MTREELDAEIRGAFAEYARTSPQARSVIILADATIKLVVTACCKTLDSRPYITSQASSTLRSTVLPTEKPDV